jgi:hypothetical protein
VAQACVWQMPKRDDSHLNLIESLLLEAGRIMEDDGPDFTRSLPDITVATARIEQLEGIADDFIALAAAAGALLRRTDPG